MESKEFLIEIKIMFIKYFQEEEKNLGTMDLLLCFECYSYICTNGFLRLYLELHRDEHCEPFVSYSEESI